MDPRVKPEDDDEVGSASHLSLGGRGYKITVLDRQGQVVDFVGEGAGGRPWHSNTPVS